MASRDFSLEERGGKGRAFQAGNSIYKVQIKNESHREGNASRLCHGAGRGAMFTGRSALIILGEGGLGAEQSGKAPRGRWHLLRATSGKSEWKVASRAEGARWEGRGAAG